MQPSDLTDHKDVRLTACTFPTFFFRLALKKCAWGGGGQEQDFMLYLMNQTQTLRIMARSEPSNGNQVSPGATLFGPLVSALRYRDTRWRALVPEPTKTWQTWQMCLESGQRSCCESRRPCGRVPPLAPWIHSSSFLIEPITRIPIIGLKKHCACGKDGICLGFARCCSQTKASRCH